MDVATKLLLSGNEAIALGAYEAGVALGCGYPGTPSTEIIETLAQRPDVYTEWSVNEKVALEVGLGLAETSEKSSHRSLVSALDDLAGLEISGKKVTDNAFKRVSDLHKEWSKQREGVQGARARLVELDAERDQQIELWSQPDTPAVIPAPEPSPATP